MSPMTPTFHNAYYTDDFFSKLEDDLSSEGVGFVQVRFPSFATLI